MYKYSKNAKIEWVLKEVWDAERTYPFWQRSFKKGRVGEGAQKKLILSPVLEYALKNFKFKAIK